MSARAISATLAFVPHITSSIALNPVVVASLLWALTRGPAGFRYRVINTFTSLRDPSAYARVVKALKWILAIKTAEFTNNALNKLAMNSWRVNNEKSRWNFNKEVAVVTGGCSGIGALVVKRLINKGVKVAVLDIQQLPAELQGYANIKFFACDVTKPSDVQAAAALVKNSLGAPSILINNAGIGTWHTIMGTEPAYLKKIFDVNVLSHYYTVQAFLPDMVENNKGHIMTIASMASFFSSGGLVDYCATKAAVLAFHEGLAQEVRVKHKAPNVLTTSVHPMWVETPLIESFKEAIKAGGSQIMEPSVVADAIAGQVFSCSGGQIFLPDNMARTSGIRGWPSWMQEKLREAGSKLLMRGL